MNQRYTLPLLILLLPFTGHSQDTARKHSSGYFFGGGQLANYAGLNGHLRSTGNDALKPASVEFGVGLDTRVRKINIGLQAFFSLGDQAAFQTYGANVELYFYTNNIRTSDVIFSPQIGIGEQFFDLDLTQRSTASSFDGAMTTNPNRTELGIDITFLDLAMRFKFLSVGGSHHSFSPDIRLGYRYGLNDARWDIRGATGSFPGAPRDRLSNFYLDLIIVPNLLRRHPISSSYTH